MAKKKSDANTFPPGKVRIRMYCQGLGDCFLLTFPMAEKPGGEFHILIDCGVIVGQPDGSNKIQQVAAHLDATTNHHIDVLVVTHEHWDHLSGFYDAREQFKNIKFDQVWLSWMENPKEPTAVELQQNRDARKKKLAAALKRPQIQSALAGGDVDAERLVGLAGFFGLEAKAVDPEEDGPARGRTGAALDFVKQCSHDLKFLEPGSIPFTVAGLTGFEFFVLGPPRDERALKKSAPTKRGDEVFHAGAHSHAMAALDLQDSNGDTELQLPFASRFGVSRERALDDPFFRQMYDDGTNAPHPAEWRRIDDLWMFSASEFALQLDSDTNNTSLVLAIRLPSGKVLLFPGDAQVGNWESWHTRDYQWDNRKVAAEFLLQNTIVYKVGHHGSHNATLRDKGLMMMDDPNLTALLPVDEHVAHEVKHWKEMPFSPMLKELHARTRGRIMRPDHDKQPALDKSVVTWLPSDEKVTGVSTRSLFLDYFVAIQ